MTAEPEKRVHAKTGVRSDEKQQSGRRKRPRLGALKPEGVSFGGGYEPVPTHVPRSHAGDGSKKHAEGVDQPSERLLARPASDDGSADATRANRAVDAPKEPALSNPKSAAASEPSPMQNTTRGTTASDDSNETRFVWLRAVPRVDQLPQLKDLDERGFAMKDILKLAGKRASAAFEPAEDFAAMPETERLPLAYAFRTSKRVSVDLLESLHDQADRLRVRSDDAMLRGQFEPIFWREIDRVVGDLKNYASA
ncbi:hypothetical protein U0C82_17395 [Fulvimarina sp. 2208YS6-2-32]|uniref:Uncharacterized protein n=1 Tax=Fulvimarina uroteuthidis TaxID=3098149 RepID=A0ABU5I9G9_9HYPH|nr:hypothetical protein [Fulvimarina sp. 2208YS6-2-32]MDY8110916.1 hypothetical protein [Fulvimarina sp. 2208YS6-2-32]